MAPLAAARTTTDAPGLSKVDLILDPLEGGVLLDFATGASSWSGDLPENLEGSGLSDRGRDGACVGRIDRLGRMVTSVSPMAVMPAEFDNLFTFSGDFSAKLSTALLGLGFLRARFATPWITSETVSGLRDSIFSNPFQQFADVPPI